MTRDEALRSDLFHWGNCSKTTGPRGGVKRQVKEVKRSGMTQTWKRDPERFRIPIKVDYYTSGEIVPSNLAEFHLPEKCPLNDGQDHTPDERHIGRIQPCTNNMLGPEPWYRAICTCGFIGQVLPIPEAANIELLAHDGTLENMVLTNA